MESDSIWMKLLWVLPMALMVAFLLPRARHMLANSPKATGDDWRGVLLPIGAVILFVLFLMFAVKH